MFYCWDLHWVKENYYQEGLLYGDCVGSLLGSVLGIIIGISVGKLDGDKVGCWLGRIILISCSRTVFIMCLPFLLTQWA